MTGLDFLDKNKKQKKTKHTDREETLVIDFRKMSSPFFLFSVFCWFLAVFIFFYFFGHIYFFTSCSVRVWGVPVLRSLELDFEKIAVTRGFPVMTSLSVNEKLKKKKKKKN